MSYSMEFTLNELRQKTLEDLLKLVDNTKTNLLVLSQKILNGSEKNVMKQRALKKSIARIKTVISEKSLLES